MAIKIKKSHKGLLHKNLGVPEGQKIPKSKLKVKDSDSPALKKRKVFAQNFAHENGGGVTLNPADVFETLKKLKKYPKGGGFMNQISDPNGGFTNSDLSKEDQDSQNKKTSAGMNSAMNLFQSGTQGGNTDGTSIGASAGSKIGGSLGSSFGPVGQFAGTALGMIVGGIGGSIVEGIHSDKLKTKLAEERATTSRQLQSQYLNRPTTPQQTYGNYKFGGDGAGNLERYSQPSHNQMNSGFSNAQLDGKGIQLEKNETLLRMKDGGDYVFSDYIGENGKTFADISKKIESKTKKPYFDPAALKTKEYELANLKAQNDAKRAEVEKPQESRPNELKQAAKGLEGDGVGEGSPLLVKDYKFDDKEVPSLETNNKTQLTAQTQLSPTNIQKVPNATLPETKGNFNILDALKALNNENGNGAQLAGESIPAIYNLARSREKPEVQNSYLDRTNLAAPQIVKDTKPFLLAQNAANRGINEGTGSQGSRLANLSNIAANTQNAIGNYDLGIQKENTGLIQRGQELQSNQAQKNNLNLYATDDINAKNRAATRNFGSKAAEQFGQTVAEYGKAKGQNKTNDIELNLLKSISQDYDMDEKGTVTYKGKPLTEFQKAQLTIEKDKKARKEVEDAQKVIDNNTKNKKNGGRLMKVKNIMY